MPTVHKVAAGECVSSIAERYGFFPDTLWNDAANARLKQLRKNPNMLLPGDQLTIPDKRAKESSKATDAHHRFRKKGVPARFRLQVFDGEEPRAHQDYTLVLDRRTLLTGTTDDAGVLSVDIPPGVQEGKLEIGPDRFEIWIDFGTLAPIDTVSGIQQRLNNLGYECGSATGELNERTRKALRRFQKRFELQVSGEADPATRGKLAEIHDAVNEFPREDPPRA